jgi:asparagine synthase (glutamine-hydrolysing)
VTALAGLWYSDGRPARDPLDRMLAAQRIYGPDHAAAWAADNVALGRRLKRILPEDRFDTGPLTSRDGRFVMVADAFLDNRSELAAALDIQPARAAAMSEAALVLAAFERWELGCFDHLYGSYAFAVWDSRDQQWILARDAMGGKPLHYHRADRCFAFASMPKGLHALPEIPYEPDTDLLARGLDLLPPDSASSCFRHIARVAMGEYNVVTASGVARHRHWNPACAPLDLPCPADYHRALRDELDRAVSVRLRGATDVGAHLSGGIDSAAIAATAARLQGSTGRVVAFTAVPVPDFAGLAPPGKLLDEGPLAAETAALYPNIDHVFIDTRGRSPLDGLDRAFHLYETPTPNLCNAVWHDAISDMAKTRGLTVMLTGQMGNLTLSYDGARLLPGLLRQGHILPLAREARALRRSGSSAASVLAHMLGPAMAGRLRRLAGRGVSSDPAERTLLNPGLRGELGLPPPAASGGRGGDSRADRLAALHRVDPANAAKGTLAHWGIDQRDPTADRRFVEFCLSVPEDQYFRDGRPSALARHGLVDRLPRAVLQSRLKGVQAADWHLGMAAAPDRLAEEADRLAACAATQRLLDLPRLRTMIDDWPADGWHQPHVATRYRIGMLRALAHGHFLRRATRSNE